LRGARGGEVDQDVHHEDHVSEHIDNEHPTRRLKVNVVGEGEYVWQRERRVNDEQQRDDVPSATLRRDARDGRAENGHADAQTRTRKRGRANADTYAGAVSEPVADLQTMICSEAHRLTARSWRVRQGKAIPTVLEKGSKILRSSSALQSSVRYSSSVYFEEDTVRPGIIDSR